MHGVLACLLLQTFAFAAIGLGLRAIVDGALAHDATAVAVGAVGAALACVTDWAVKDIGFTLRMQLVERVALDVDAQLLRSVIDIEGLDHLERTEYLDRITVVRGETWGIVDSAWAALESVAHVVRLALTLALLGSVSPWLLLLLPLALLPLWLSRFGRGRVRRAQLAVAEDIRLQQHLFELCTSADAGKEIRVTGSGPELVRRQADAWNRVVSTRFHAYLLSAAVTGAGWGIFALGFAGGLALVVRSTAAGNGSPGDLVLVVTVGAQLRGAVENTVRRSIETGDYARLITPYLWLRDYHAAERAAAGRGSAPGAVLREGVSLREVTYTYPGKKQPAVEGVTADLKAGTVVAVVGTYGSGKTTLIKLLAKFYRPDAGSIHVDGTDLEQLDTGQWRSRMSAAFQDFGRYRTTVGEGVGLGEPALLEDRPRIDEALRAAEAEEFVTRLPQGQDTLLGKEFGGVELSEGQWQKLALARASMRRGPLLFVLDEPTASLDAPSERAVFERYMAHARTIARTSGAITVIVSHRFSTVAGSDLILVMDRGRLVESGDHETLMARGGTYAGLYSLQADVYTRDAHRPARTATSAGDS